MSPRHFATALLCLGALSLPALAGDIGQIKKTTGSVSVDRAGKTLAATNGMRLEATDLIVTGANGSVGITLSDNTLLSAGPNTQLELSRYAFDSTTHAGRFDATLRRGTLSMVSGKLAKQSPDAVKVITPSSVLAVRGTEFFVQVDDAN